MPYIITNQCLIRLVVTNTHQSSLCGCGVLAVIWVVGWKEIEGCPLCCTKLSMILSIKKKFQNKLKD